MRVVVLVKHVPELLSARAIGDDRRTVREPTDSTLNEVDENAVEAALQLVEADGGEVTALTLGPQPAVDALRRALAMGAQHAVHVLGEEFAGGDVIATARALAAAVRHLHAQQPVDVAVCGLAALDGLGSVVPSLLAAEFGWPQLSAVSELSLDGGALVGVRDLDGVTERWRARTPAVVSVTDASNDARMPQVAALVAARTAHPTTLTAADLGLTALDVGAAGSRTEVVTAAPSPPHPGPVLVHDTGDGGAQLAQYLIDGGFVGERS